MFTTMSDDETYLDDLEFYEQKFNHTPLGRKGVKRKHDARPERAIDRPIDTRVEGNRAIRFRS